MSPAAIARATQPPAQHVPARWTLIAPGWDKPVPFAHVEDLAERLSSDAKGEPIVLSAITCTYPGYDTFQALKVEAMDGQSGQRTYVGVVVAAASDAATIQTAVRQAGA